MEELKKNIIGIKIRQRPWIDISLNKTYKWSTGIWQDVQYLYFSEKWKSQPRWAITSYLGWLLLFFFLIRCWWRYREKETFAYYCCQAAPVVSDPVRPHRRQPTRLPRPWDSPGKNTGMGCHFPLHLLLVECKLVQPLWEIVWKFSKN